ncbi:MAG: leucine-rich repeat protein [Kiritimatiellae bacterium]|nr:leucine-rich repeat protein [Kiritimatiellia bacterium]
MAYVTLHADTAVVDGITWTYQVSNGKAQIYKNASSPAIPSNTSGAITIPDKLGGYSVTSIGRSAFYNCSSLTSVTIPSSVTSIGYDAFRDCSSLTSVTIPSSVTSIGGSAFRDCSSLTSVTIPSSVTTIGDYAFEGCSSLTSVHISDVGAWCLINFENRRSNPLYYAKDGLYLNGEKITTAVIPEVVTTIGNWAFLGCSSLTSVTIPSSVTTIGDYAFEGCSSLTSVTIPSSVTTIGDYAFRDCSSLTSVTIPSSVTTIGDYAFEGCSSLTSVTIPKGVTSIGRSAFYNCSSLTSVTIPSSVTSIGYEAFRGCSRLTSVTIPSSVTSIGYEAFRGCSRLTSVTIPSSVTSIGSQAFYGCYDLQWVQFLGDVPEGYGSSSLSEKQTLFPREYGANWEKLFSASSRGTVAEAYSTAMVSVTAEMTTPTTMKVTYTVTSNKETVKVRAVAFKDGVRSFANLVPVKTAAEDSPEAIPNGSAVTANVAHTFVWNVPSDWEEDLAKVAMEILVQGGELLPQELITIPATNTHKAMTITRNTLSTSQTFNALLWCVVEGDAALTVSNGVVKVNGQTVAIRQDVATHDGQKWISFEGLYTSVTWYSTALLNYLYGRMGYKVLTGADLTYAEAVTRLVLSTSGLTQVAVKIEEE